MPPLPSWQTPGSGPGRLPASTTLSPPRSASQPGRSVCYAERVPRFEPFPGLRYDQAVLAGRGATLDDVIAPPYDVIDELERESLVARSAYNAVRVELPVDEGGVGRYERARRLMAEWQSSGLLVRDDPGLYVYRMSYTDHLGRRRRSTGVMGALEVSVPGTGDVIPHERTMPKPKGDRLDLLRACRANLSPVWGLSLAPGLSDAVSRVTSAPPDCAATDAAGVLHELWHTDQAAETIALTKVVQSAPVVIADGHHRYETAVAYRDERRSATGGEAGPAELVMALVVELTPDELAVRPIHRLLSGLPEGFDLPKALSVAFDVEVTSETGPAIMIETERSGALGLLTPAGAFLLRPRPSTVEAAGEELDSSFVEVASQQLPAHDLTYEADFDTVTSAVTKGKADAAVILRPATVTQIADCAHQRRRMPPKTTYFYPKPRTGMVFRPLVT
jgi:uncharacterized protein (DUF1015 family)